MIRTCALYDALYDMLDADKLDRFLEKALSKSRRAFMRGRTLNDSFVILDEAQILPANR